jgi:hypothetical protein
VPAEDPAAMEADRAVVVPYRGPMRSSSAVRMRNALSAALSRMPVRVCLKIACGIKCGAEQWRLQRITRLLGLDGQVIGGSTTIPSSGS